MSTPLPPNDANASGTDTKKQIEILQARIGLIESDDRKASDAIDQIVLIGGPAAILASLSFMKDMAPQPVPGSLDVLFVGWGSLLLGAVSAMAGLYTTRQAGRHLRRLYEAKVGEGKPEIRLREYDPARRWNDRTRWASQLGISAFILGIVFVLAFARTNLVAANASHSAASQTAQGDTASTNSLFRECQRLRCAIFIGYDYDLLRGAAQQAGKPSGTQK